MERDMENFVEGTPVVTCVGGGQEQEHRSLRSRGSTVRDCTHPMHPWDNLALGPFIEPERFT